MTNLLIILCSFFIILIIFIYIDLTDKKDTIKILKEQYKNEITLNSKLQNKIFNDKEEKDEKLKYLLNCQKSTYESKLNKQKEEFKNTLNKKKIIESLINKNYEKLMLYYKGNFPLTDDIEFAIKTLIQLMQLYRNEPLKIYDFDNFKTNKTTEDLINEYHTWMG